MPSQRALPAQAGAVGHLEMGRRHELLHAPSVAPAPLLGEHGTAVLGEWLKMDKDQIAALRNTAVLT